MTALADWARANPIWSRLWIKLGLRLPLALALVVGLQALADRFAVSANLAAIMGVVVALWAGGKLADIVYSRLGIADVKP
jgi:hypothetical protein